MTKFKNTVDIWFFDEITIGYCRKCCCAAEYSMISGLRCPECKTNDISIFTWNKESPNPDE